MALHGAYFRISSFICVVTAVLGVTITSVRAQSSLLDVFSSSSDKKKPVAGAPAPGKAVATDKAKVKPKKHAVTAAARGSKVNDKVLVILGSGGASAYTQIAGDITSVVDALPQKDLRVISMIGKSSEQNLRDMVSLKGMDLAVVEADALELLKTKDPKTYAKVSKEVKYIARLFPVELHVYARPETKSLEDLRGKTVSCQLSTAAAMCETIFKTLKIDVKIVYEEEASGRQKLKNGEVAAVALGGTPPEAALEKVAAEDRLHLVPISEESLPNSDFAALLKRYQPAKLRHQDYPGLISQGEYVPTISTEAVLVIHTGPAGNARHALGQKFANLLLDHIDSLRVAPRHPRWREVNISAELTGWTRYRPVQEWLESRRNATGGAIMSSAVVEDDPRVKAAFDKFMEDYSKATGKPIDEKQKDELYPQFVEYWHKKSSK